MPVEELIFVNALLAFATATTHTREFLNQTHEMRLRIIHAVIAFSCVSVGIIYGGTLFDHFAIVDASGVYFRPILTLLLIALFILPIVEPDGPEAIRKEKDSLIKAIQAEYKEDKKAMRREFEQEKSLLFGWITEAQQKIQELSYQVDELTDQLSILRSTGGDKSDKPSVLVCTGNEQMFDIDLSVLRKIRARTGLRFKRLYPVNRTNFRRSLNRFRMLERPVKHIHFACHMSEEGMLFGDGLVSVDWISQIVGNDLEVAVLGGCTSDTIGDMIPAQYVISFTEEIENGDAALFAEAFWGAIGDGLDPDEAFELTMKKVPPAITEFVVRHW